jgi:glycosyltransferase involved in cell wall biosynthesis
MTQPDGSQQEATDRSISVTSVGQTPPPFGGQAIMIDLVVHGHYCRLRFHHVRLVFSRTMGSVGRFQFRKVLHVGSVIFRTLWSRFRFKTQILYYPPGGQGALPFVRDVVLLGATRWAFKGLVLHFHAGGLHDRLSRLPWWLRRLCLAVYSCPRCAIVLSRSGSSDVGCLSPRRVAVIPNGIADAFPDYRHPRGQTLDPLRILFVGVLCESKGLLDLISACGILRRSGVRVNLTAVGQWQPDSFEVRARALVRSLGLEDAVAFPGVLTGAVKWREYALADVFCFPSYFECESLPVVILEAMQFEMIVIASRWRGIPDMISDGLTGLLVEPRSPKEVATKLTWVVANPEAARKLGANARSRFLSEFSVEAMWSSVESTMLQALE